MSVDCQGLKFCRDCEHVDVLSTLALAKCKLLQRCNPVTGQMGYIDSSITFCSSARTAGASTITPDTFCGPEGLLWEERHD